MCLKNFRFFILAVRTGLEPATPCVTGTYSNQLNYRTSFSIEAAKIRRFYFYARPETKFFNYFIESRLLFSFFAQYAPPNTPTIMPGKLTKNVRMNMILSTYLS